MKVASNVSPRPDGAPSSALGIFSLDWNVLVEAVEVRLNAIAGKLLDQNNGLPAHEAPDPAQLALLECATALQQLHRMLIEEPQEYRQPKSNFLACGTALIRARAKFVGLEGQTRFARQQPVHDSLTELPDRGHFVERTDAALANLGDARGAVCVGLAALYIDLDDFKSINHLHGHHVGDKVLQVVAARLVRAVRADDFVGRVGGDEFACLLTSLPSKAQLRQLACKLFDAVSAPMQIGTHELTVRASIGIAVHPRDGETSEALLRSADEAMYCAKRHQTGYAFLERTPVD